MQQEQHPQVAQELTAHVVPQEPINLTQDNQVVFLADVDMCSQTPAQQAVVACVAEEPIPLQVLHTATPALVEQSARADLTHQAEQVGGMELAPP